MTSSMLWRHCLPCFIWLLVWKTSSAGNSEKYLVKGFDGDLTAVAEKLKYFHLLARNGDGSEASTEAVAGLPSQCPFFAELESKLKALKEEREEAINTSLSAIRDLVSPEKLACDNITEVRDKVLEKLNASLTCEAPPVCNESLPYRQPDGSCNNIKNPEWGKADTCFRRILSPAYADGVSKPRVSCNTSELPNARLISITLHNEVNKTHENLTHLAMIFGQFLTHDITFVSFAPLSSIEFELGPGPFYLCEDNDTACIAIQVPENDTFYSQFNITRLPMMRSLTCSDCKLGYKEQVNSRTTYMDLSQVYGIKADILATLRKFEKGLLISQEAECVEYPPDSPFPYLDNCSLPNKNMKCHWTGDLRAPQHIALLSTQTLWLREHNRIAKNLSSLYPHWDDERLFQTARRIVEARYQHIVFSEYLPKMIGENNMKTFNLTPLETGFTTYDENVDPTLPNEFSAAAFRFGHPQANKDFWRFSEKGEWLEPLNLSTGYFIPHNNTDANHNSVLRGSVKQLSQEFNRHGDVSVRGNLFRLAELQYGFDLFAIDIQRGREHGLRPYVDYVKHCGNITVQDFEDLKYLMAEDNVTHIFQKLYTDVRDIDLYSGGLSEKPIEGGQMGETFACIVREAFRRLKFGDRFYYEHTNQSGSFTEEQLNSIRNTTLASVFCNNIYGLTSIQRDVFLKVSNDRAFFVSVLCVAAATQASFAAGLPRRALDRLADEARESLVRKLEAIDSEEAVERDDQVVYRASSAPEPSGCPFARGEDRNERNVTSEARSAEVAAIYEETTRELLSSLGEGDEAMRKATLAHVNRRLKRGTGDSCSDVCPVQATATCDPDKPYREPDGSCNNLDNPDWGKAYACEKRLLDPDYADGVSTLRVAKDGSPLPSARLVSYKVHPEKFRPDRRLTHLSMAFGQFIDHDIAFSPPNTLPPLETFLGVENGYSNGTEKLDIEVPKDDPFYSKFGRTSLFFERSLPCSQCELGPRQQMNSRTSFIDASQIYGIKKPITDTLRAFSDGLLKEEIVGGSVLMPPSLDPNNDTCSSPDEGKICFRSGDFRVNQNVGLVVLHTLFLREHNRIARKLSAINPHWDDERTFQVTRRIVESRYQNVVFYEWLPEIIGPEATKRYGLHPRSSGYTKYDPHVDPTMVNEFAAAAFRFSHSDIHGHFKLFERNGKQVGDILLKDNYFQPFDFYKGRIEDTALRGFIRQPMQTTGRYGDTAVTNYLFRMPGEMTGGDLFAIDMQRGRDHGTRPYSDYVKLCRNVTIDSFEDLYEKKLMPAAIAKLYSTIYVDVRDIDLFSAGLNEPAVEGAAMGPTFLCIVSEMFSKLKYGDRFYFEHGYQAGSFTPEQLESLRETTLAKIICENTGIKTKLQKNVFRLPSRGKKVDCEDLPDIRLHLWTDKP